jgi:hypothetical protein
MAAVAADNVELPAGADERARRDAHAASFARARESIALNLFRARPAVNATMSTIWREGLALGAAIEAKLPSAAAAERAEPEELSPLRHRPFEFSPRALAAQPPALATKVAKAAQPAAGGGAATKASAADGDASASPLPRLGPSIATLEQFEAGQRAACERWREHLVYHWLSHSESTLVSGLQEHAVFNVRPRAHAAPARTHRPLAGEAMGGRTEGGGRGWEAGRGLGRRIQKMRKVGCMETDG